MREILIAWWYFRSQEKDDSAAHAARLTQLLSDVRSGAGAAVADVEWESWCDQVQSWLRPNLNPECPAEIVELDIRRTSPDRGIAAGSVDVDLRGASPVRSWFVVEFDAALSLLLGDVLDFDPRPSRGV